MTDPFRAATARSSSWRSRAEGTVRAAVLALVPYCAYVFCYSLVATPERGPLFYGFVVDGEHAALALLLVALEPFG